MGFSETATHTLFFIAAVVMASITVAAFNGSVQQFVGDVADRSRGVSDGLAADVRIINDPGNVPNGPLILYVLNTGSRALFPDETVVLANGVAHTTLTIVVIDGDDEVWRQGEVARITVPGLTLPTGDHRVKVVAQYGATDTIRFSI